MPVSTTGQFEVVAIDREDSLDAQENGGTVAIFEHHDRDHAS